MNLGLREILPIILLVVLLFGAKKIPQLARSIGAGLREFKKASRNHAPKDQSREEG